MCSVYKNWLNWLLISNLVYVCMLSHFSHVQLFMTLRTVALQSPVSMGFSRQKYWSRLPCHPLGDLPNPGIEPTSLLSPALAGRLFTTGPTWDTSINIFKEKKKEKKEAPFSPAMLSKKLFSQHHENYSSILKLFDKYLWIDLIHSFMKEVFIKQ